MQIDKLVIETVSLGKKATMRVIDMSDWKGCESSRRDSSFGNIVPRNEIQPSLELEALTLSFQFHVSRWKACISYDGDLQGDDRFSPERNTLHCCDVKTS